MSKTEKNISAAFTGESMARNKYAYYAEIARKEGYHYIAKIFEETADNEKYHAMEELKLLYPERTTAQNLKEAIEAEQHELEEMYPKFAQEAEVEGNRPAEILFTQISKIEKEHRARFAKLLAMVETGTVFRREHRIKWKCIICGYTYEGYEPPTRCPYCKRSKEYYEPAWLDV